MMDELLSNTKTWFTLPEATKQAVTTSEFTRLFSNDKDYATATPEVKEQLKQSFQKQMAIAAYNSEYNPKNIDALAKQTASEHSGAFDNIFTKIADSHRDALGRISMVPDAMNPDGILSEKFAERMAVHAEKQKARIVTNEERRVAETLLTAEEKVKKAGNGWWSLDGLKAAAGTVPELMANPIGVWDLAADSASSMTVMGLGALTGSKTGGFFGGLVGSAIPGLGTAAGAATGATVGAATGMFTAEMADAATSKLTEIFDEKLKAKGLIPTKENYQLLAQDQAFVKDAQLQSIKYSATLAATDTATGAIFARFATAPARAALKAAREVVVATDHTALAISAKAAGLSVEKFTEQEANKIASATLKAQNFKAKMGHHVASYLGEVAGEPLSEYTASTSIGKDVTFTDLMNETLGGIGSGPIGASVNTAAMGTKIASDGVVGTVKDVINSTPETRATAAEQKAVLNQLTDLNHTEAVHKYADKIAAIDPESDTFKNLSDPTHASYNPIAAMDALVSKQSDPATHTQALQIADDYDVKRVETNNQLKALVIKKNAEGLTDAEEKQAKFLFEVSKKQKTIVDKLYDRIDILKTNINNAKGSPVTVDTVTDSPETLITKLGSHGSINNKDTVTIAQLNTAIARPDMTSGIKEELETLKEAKQLREAIETKATTNTKTISDVAVDIYHGIRGSYFKGVDAYKEGIQHFLNPQVNNPDKAQAELDALRKFSTAHSLKAEMITSAFEALSNKKEVAPDVQQYLTDNEIKIHPVLSKNYVPTIQREALALQKEVKLAEMTYNRLSGKTNTTTSTPVQKPATATIQKPKTVSVTLAPVVINAPAKPVVESKPNTPVTQTRAEKFTALKADVTNKTTTPEGVKYMQDALVEAKADGNTNIIAKIEKFTHEYETAHIANNTKPEATTAPQTASNKKDIVALAPDKVVAPIASQEAQVNKKKRVVINAFHGAAEDFDLHRTGPDNYGNTQDWGAFGKGFYYTDMREEAEFYAANAAGKAFEQHRDLTKMTPMIHKAQITINNPVPDNLIEQTNSEEEATKFTKRMVALGYDGLIVEDMSKFGMKQPHTKFGHGKHIVVFSQKGISKQGPAENMMSPDYNKQAENVITVDTETAPKPEAIVTPAPTEVVAPTESVKAPAEVIVDKLAEYDKAYAALQITYTNAFGQEVTESYEKAVAENEKQLFEANEVLRCVNS